MSKITQGFKHLVSCGITVREWVEIFGVAGKWLGAKSRSLFKFEEFGKGTIRQSTQSAITYTLEIWLGNKQELFLTSRRRALSRGCVRGKPVDCAWKLCLPGENFTTLPEKSESRETRRYRLCQPEHTQHSAMEQRPPEREWRKRLVLTTEDRASIVNLRDAFSKCVGWQGTCSPASHGWASLSLSLALWLYSLGQHGSATKSLPLRTMVT